ncbi:hypothetical protein [Thermomonospora umbrina]|uniref:Uncharacterized protein n=1 Tax=Thermomonospora umbrina TaxID=111806 RepID=A0A3D9SK50_9ACTN|nr:hypothetical protein [Thermomonospora umbrina]REE96087.1 hypothetical protein DFJ69_1511 [Thermomonospora umbrina]
MDETNLIARLGADVPPLSDGTRAETRARLLAQATDTSGNTTGATPPRKDRRGRRLGFRLAAVGAVAAAALTAAAVLQPWGGTPAYAVEKRPDGSVRVEIREFLEPEKVEASLREAGITAVVDYLPKGKSCRQPRGRQAATLPGGGVLEAQEAEGGPIVFIIQPGQLKPGQTLVLEASFDRDHPDQGAGFSTTTFQGPVAACAPVDGPAAPFPGDDGSGGGEGPGDITPMPAQPR